MINTTHLHPIIVHFPVALITVGFLFDMAYLFYKKEVCLSKAGFYLTILGTLGAIAAFTTGQLFTDEPTQGEIMNVFTKHENGALITMILMIIASLIRSYMLLKKSEDSKLKWLVIIILLLGFISVTITGHMGGTMVYDYMLGI